jgi:hypothetical protein
MIIIINMVKASYILQLAFLQHTYHITACIRNLAMCSANILAIAIGRSINPDGRKFVAL